MLSTRAVVAVGLISHPLYLWHWPSLFAVRSLGLDTPAAQARTARLAAIALSLLVKDSFCGKRGCLTSVGERLGRVTVVWHSNHIFPSDSGLITREHVRPMKKRLTTGRETVETKPNGLRARRDTPPRGPWRAA